MSEPRRDGFQIFLMVASLALAVLVILLAIENRRLKSELIAAHETIPSDALAAGDRVGPIDLLDEAGAMTTLDPSQNATGTILLLFSTQCPACEKTLPLWSEVFSEEAGPAAPRTVAVQLDRGGEDEGPTSLVAAAYPFPVYGVTEAGLGGDLSGRIPFIPATVLLDEGGTVLDVWYGVPEEDDLDALRSARAP